MSEEALRKELDELRARNAELEDELRDYALAIGVIRTLLFGNSRTEMEHLLEPLRLAHKGERR